MRSGLCHTIRQRWEHPGFPKVPINAPTAPVVLRSLAQLLQFWLWMKEICQDIKSHVSEVLVEWENLVREEPWYSLPADHRIDSLPDVIVGLVQASLCNPLDREAHGQNVTAAAKHGSHRREQGIPEHLILTEYHLLRQAIWRYLISKFPVADPIAHAMMRIDSAITLATNASMWGYFRPEIEGAGKWEEGIERIVSSSPLLHGTPGGAMPSKAAGVIP